LLYRYDENQTVEHADRQRPRVDGGSLFQIGAYVPDFNAAQLLCNYTCAFTCTSTAFAYCWKSRYARGRARCEGSGFRYQLTSGEFALADGVDTFCIEFIDTAAATRSDPPQELIQRLNDGRLKVRKGSDCDYNKGNDVVIVRGSDSPEAVLWVRVCLGNPIQVLPSQADTLTLRKVDRATYTS